MDLKTRLSELRRDRGLTQQELAEALNVSRQTISRWEVGTVVPTLDNLMCLSRVYGVPLDDFISAEGKTSEPPAEKPAAGENLPIPARAGRPQAVLASLLLAALLLGVGVLIGMNLPREEPPAVDPGNRVDVSGPRGWLERTPTDIEDELQWLETTVKDLLEEDQPLP